MFPEMEPGEKMRFKGNIAGNFEDGNLFCNGSCQSTLVGNSALLPCNVIAS